MCLPYFQPEISVAIVQLRLVQVCDVLRVDRDPVRVSTRTTHCARSSVGWGIADEVGDKVLAPHRVVEVNVDIVFDPPWEARRADEALVDPVETSVSTAETIIGRLRDEVAR